MQSWQRAPYVALKDFKYTVVRDIESYDIRYREGDIINLRTSEKMTTYLLGQGCIKLLNEKE